MEKEKMNRRKLFDEELKQVTGGNNGAALNECHHPGSYVNWHTGEKCEGPGASLTVCDTCTHWIRPEGPCDLD